MKKLDTSMTLPPNISPAKFNSYPREVQIQIVQAMVTQQGVMFRDLHPEFIFTDKNSQALEAFLLENDLPATVRNLEFGFETLLREDKLPDVRGCVPGTFGKQPITEKPAPRRARPVEDVKDGGRNLEGPSPSIDEPSEAECKVMDMATLKAAAIKSRRSRAANIKAVDRGTLQAVI
jgi:hypothetical protein